jgi:hypothetical protein
MMPVKIELDGDSCWPDLGEKARSQLIVGELSGVALLPDGELTRSDGTPSQRPILTFRIELPDGKTVLAQTTVDLINMLVSAVKGRLEYLADLRTAGGGTSS